MTADRTVAISSGITLLVCDTGKHIQNFVSHIFWVTVSNVPNQIFGLRAGLQTNIIYLALNYPNPY